MIIIIITHCASITSSSTTTIEANIPVLIVGALAVMVTVAMVTFIVCCAVVGVRYIMVTAVLVALEFFLYQTDNGYSDRE